MRYPGFHFLWVPFVLACQPSGEGLGTESEGPTSSGSGTTMAETAPATTSEGTTEGVDGSATSSGSGPATGSSGGSGTDDGPGTSSGPGEESSSGGDPPGPGAGEPYGPCDEGACTGEGVVCWADHPGFDMCLPPCDGTNPSCPDAPGGTAYPECIGAVGVLCMLNCEGGLTCPEGTMCEEVFDGIFRCLWP